MKKTGYFLFCILFFTGCQKTGTPSCAEQWRGFEACSMEQMESVPCEGSYFEGEKRGHEAAEYCGKQNFAPNFKEKCKETAKDAFPNFIKKWLEFAIKKCGN